MKCPECGSDKTSVDADLSDDHDIVAEYRFCWDCNHEWDRVKHL